MRVLPRQGMVGPSSDSRRWLRETSAGASSAVNGRDCRRLRTAGGDWPDALANVQAGTLRENCRLELASFSEASEEGILEQPNRDRNGEGFYGPGISHQKNWVSRRGRDSGMYGQYDKAKKGRRGERPTSLASSRTGENPPRGMNGGGGGNIGMTRGLFATMPERADTPEAIALNSDAPPLHSTSSFYDNFFLL